MELNELITILVVGCLAGWIAGLIMRGGGFGIIGNIVVGIIGAFAGRYLFDVLDVRIGTGIAGALVTAVIGAVVVLFIIGLIRGKK